MTQLTERERWYLVVSREYGTVDTVLDYGQGPMEYGRDVLFVRSGNAKRAKTLFVRAMRRRTGARAWKDAPWLTDGNPFAGMTATRCSEIPDEPEEAEA